jgi:two-component system OmpR family response regulator
MARVLSVDDEPGVRQLVRRVLEQSGHEVITAGTGADALRLVGTEQFDLVTLDLVLPDVEGFTLLAAMLNRVSDLRVIVLSCVVDLEMRLQCLEVGAVDFMVKPFSVRELRARVQCRLSGPGPRPVERVLEQGALRLDLVRHRLAVGSKVVELSPREFYLLEYLMRRAGSVCSREELVTQVWGYSYDPCSNVVEVAVARLRAKVAGDDVIETVRNVGYAVAAG